MSLRHEKLDVYRLSIDYVAWVFAQAEELSGTLRHARDQWLRASQSIPLNIAEGNGKTSDADRRRYFEIARGSALECAAIQDVLRVGEALDENEHLHRKNHLDRIVAMLSRLGGRGYVVQEESEIFGSELTDPDPDPDPDCGESQPSGVRYAHTNLVVDDWKKAVAFYRDVFDCQPVGAERDHHGPHVEALTGLAGANIKGVHLRLPGFGENGPTLEVFEYGENAPQPAKSAHLPGFAHIAFEVDDVEEKRREVLARGGGELGQLQSIDIPGAGRLTLVYLTDPEGNIIELQRWHR
ncbi:MAG: four helix bundle protein [Verrucomicrobiales bacterium]